MPKYPEEKNRAGVVTLLDFRYYYPAVEIKAACDCHKNRHVDQYNRVDSPEIIPCNYRQLIFDKGGKNTQWGKGSFFSK